jgi:hypothetical protein
MLVRPLEVSMTVVKPSPQADLSYPRKGLECACLYAGFAELVIVPPHQQKSPS